MIKKVFFILICFVLALSAKSQNVGVNTTGATPNSSALLDIDATGLSPKLGLLIPRVTSAEKTAMNPLSAAAQGLLIYQTDGVQGFYYNTSTTTVPVWNYLTNATPGWTTAGNTLTGTLPGTPAEWIGTANAADWIIKSNNVERMRILSTGNVGIGTTAPGATLEVVGSTKTTNFQMTSGATLGYVLVSGTAAGNAVWVNPTSFYTIGTGLSMTGITLNSVWTASGTNIYNNNTGNVGIGIAAPLDKLHVVGNIRTSSLAGFGTRMVQADLNGTLLPLAAGTSSQVLLGTGVWGSVPTNTAWSLTGNSGTTVGTNFIGTTDAQPFEIKVNNNKAGYIDYVYTNGNTGFGYQSLNANTSGAGNSAFGYQALFSNTSGVNNNAFGIISLLTNTTGSYNSAYGNATLQVNTTGSFNTAIGNSALTLNTSGVNNAALGYSALAANSTGGENTATGMQAMYANTTGSYNTASGYQSLYSNTTGGGNTAYGVFSLFSVTSGSNNAAFGGNALNSNTGDANTAMGGLSLYSNTSGAYNSTLGLHSLYSNATGNYNTAIGYSAGESNVSGSGNVFLGNNAGYNETGSNKLYIANSSSNPPLIYGDFSTARVGIGTAAPAANLEVDGASGSTIKIADGNQGIGKVLTSDAAGQGSWQTPAAATVMQSEVILVTHSSFGTVNTTVPRFATVINNIGTDLTYSDSPTNGTSITVNTTGVYFVSLQLKQVWNFNASAQWGIMKNAGSDPGMTSANQLCFDWNYESLSTAYHTASATVYLTAGDVVRPFYSAPQNNESRFEIRRVH